MKWIRHLLPLLVSCSAMAELSDEARRGEQVFNERDKGHCLLCHSLSGNRSSFQGNLGPPLDGVAKRMTKDELIRRIADSRVFNSETIMPPYFSVEGLRQVGSDYVDKTVLTENELSDLVSYLLSDNDE